MSKAHITAGFFFLIVTSVARTQDAELVVRNADVLTMDAAQPRVREFAVVGGKFKSIGNEDDVKALIGPETKVLDLAGKTVVPGFIDAHAHPSPIYDEDRLWATADVAPPKVKTIDDLIAALKRKADKTPKGAWVKGSGYQETILGRHPTRHDLDRASGDHPIIISHSSGHLRVCNSYALKLAGIDRDTKNPSGGEFDRDAKGELTGLIKEGAASGVVIRAGPNTPSPPRAEIVDGYRKCFREFFSRGLTSIHVAGTSASSAELMAVACDDSTPMHLYVMLREGEIDDAVERSKKMGPAPRRMRFGPIKFFHGNSLSGQTCWLSKPYSDRPDYFGIPPARSQAKLDQLVMKIHKAGLQGCIHSNGDREIDMVLTAFERALAAEPRDDHRHRIEHCSIVNDDILRRIKKLGLVVAPHSYVFEHGDKMEAYGADRWDWMHADRAMIDIGIPVAGNSDFPVSAADPLLRIQSMVTRKCVNNGKVYGEKQRCTVEQALAAWTRGGAFASFEEKNRGSIEVGKQADFVVLDADPTKANPDAIREIIVEQTVVAGRVVFSAK